MSRRRGTASLGASPVLIGAATVLVALVAVFIAYNANAGLPFVPTYDLNAELPSGGKLVKGNEVRVGGFRVGVVKDIKPKLTTVNGERRSVAVAELNLDKKIEPLSRDTQFRVRPRSALGLKYIELQPGTSKATWQSGDTVPVKQSSEPLEFEDLFSTFDRETRPNIQRATDGFGNAFAGRGQAINRSIQALNPFFKALTPVMRNLSDPDTELDQFFLQMGRASAQVAPVAQTQALLFTDMADTFAAISADPRALQDTIEKGAPTMDVSIDSFRVQRPFMRRLHRPLGSAAARGGAAAALAPRNQQRLQGRHAGAAADGRAERQPREGLQRGERPVREPEHAARPEGPRPPRSRSPARRSSTSRPTRRSAATSTTSCTRWARCSRWSRRAPPAAARS